MPVAEERDRVPYGLEYEPERAEYVRERVTDPGHVRQGSVLELETTWLPACELVFTSPPFMEQAMATNPFENYEDRVTTLARDVADRVSTVLDYQGEVVVTWAGDGPGDNSGSFGYGYDHSYCLVFKRSD